MSLNNMVVFLKYYEAAFIEYFTAYVAKFNEASKGSIILTSGKNPGDFIESSFFEEMGNLINSRNPRVDGALSDVTFTMDRARSVKFGRSAGPVKWDPTQFKTLNMPVEMAGVVAGRNLAAQKLKREFDLALSILIAAMSNDAASLRTDVSAVVGGNGNSFNLANINTARSKFGDAYDKVVCWIVHSKPMFDLFGSNITNSGNLFDFPGIKISQDHMGTPIIMVDSPSLVNTVPNPDQYRCLALTPGAIVFEENDDYTEMSEPILGRTNLGYRWQAEWSVNAAVKGYRWDSTNGGAFPNDAALVVSTNWDNIVNTHKNLPGLELIVV